MVDFLFVSILVVHIVASAAWIGGAFFLEVALGRGLQMIPQAHRVTLANGIGRSFTFVAWVSLGVISLTGVLMTYLKQGLSVSFLFLTTPGLVLTVGMSLTVVAIFNGFVLSLVLAPRLLSKDQDTAVAASKNSMRLIETNTILGMGAILLMAVFAEMVRW